MRSRRLLATPDRSGLRPRLRLSLAVRCVFRLCSASRASPVPRTTMPSADSCHAIRPPYGGLSPCPMTWTRDRPPEVSSPAFTAHPPDLQPRRLVDVDFVVKSRLVPACLPRIRFLSIGSRLCSRLPSDPASRRRPCPSLALHLHQVVQGTFTPKLTNMLGTLFGGPVWGRGDCVLAMERACWRGAASLYLPLSAKKSP